MKLDEVKLIKDLYQTETANIQQKLVEHGIDLSSIYQELEMTSRFIDTHMDVSFGDIPVNLHSHTFYEIVYVLSNSGTQYLIGTKRYSLQRGDIIFVPPGVGHKPLFPPELAEPYRRIVMWISQEFMDDLERIVPYAPFPNENRVFLLRTTGEHLETLGQFFHKGLQESRECDKGWNAVLYGNTLQFLVHFYRAMLEPENRPPQTEKPELLDDVVSYIETHLADKITLSDIARRFYVSESTIGQTFQKKMHVSFYHYVTQRRLISAKSMIGEGQNLSELCLKVGFSDYSTFYRAFKKEFGISPKDYRKLIAET